MRTIITCVISCAGTAKNIPVLKTCIQSLIKAETPSIRIRVVVTTNNVHHCIRQTKQIDRIIVSPKQAGFVDINNKAVNETIGLPSSFYLIINDDAWVERNFFRELLKTFRNNDGAGVFVPYIVEGKTKKLDSFGVEYFRTGYSKNAFSSKITTSLASMSCLIIATPFLKTMIHTYGYFLNPLLKWYLDDVDFSIRALAIGGSLVKCRLMIAHHLRTFTWGRKSFMVMYQSFRNLLWIIIMTWPKSVIQKNLFRICCWQIITSMYCTIKYSPLMYPKILFDTFKNLGALMNERRRVTRRYLQPKVFSSMFSSLEVRHQRMTF